MVSVNTVQPGTNPQLTNSTFSDKSEITDTQRDYLKNPPRVALTGFTFFTKYQVRLIRKQKRQIKGNEI